MSPFDKLKQRIILEVSSYINFAEQNDYVGRAERGKALIRWFGTQDGQEVEARVKTMIEGCGKAGEERVAAAEKMFDVLKQGDLNNPSTWDQICSYAEEVYFVLFAFEDLHKRLYDSPPV